MHIVSRWVQISVLHLTLKLWRGGNIKLYFLCKNVVFQWEIGVLHLTIFLHPAVYIKINGRVQNDVLHIWDQGAK